MLFAGNKKYDHDKIKIYINNEALKKIVNYMFLGVITDTKLCWKEQVKNVCNKITRSIGIISKIRHLVNHKCLLTLHYSPIYPYLNYGNIVWGNTFTTYINSIFTLQKMYSHSNFFQTWDPKFTFVMQIKYSEHI